MRCRSTSDFWTICHENWQDFFLSCHCCRINGQTILSPIIEPKNCQIKMFPLLRIIYHILWSWFKRKWKGVNAVSTNQQNSYCLNIYRCHWSQEFPSVVSHRGCCLYDMDPTRSTQWAQFFVSLDGYLRSFLVQY